MVLHSRGCGRVARRRFTRIGPPGRAFGSREAPFLCSLSGLPVELSLREHPFFIRSRPLFIRLPVLAPRGMQEFLFRGTFVSHGLSA